MEELRKKQKLKRQLYSVPALVVLGFITFFFIRGTYIVFMKKVQSGTYVATLQAKAQALEEKQTELEHNIESLKTPDGIEKEVKEKYNVSKPGEHVVILVDKQGVDGQEATDTRAWYEKAWDAILGAL